MKRQKLALPKKAADTAVRMRKAKSGLSLLSLGREVVNSRVRPQGVFATDSSPGFTVLGIIEFAASDSCRGKVRRVMRWYCSFRRGHRRCSAGKQRNATRGGCPSPVARTRIRRRNGLVSPGKWLGH